MNYLNLKSYAKVNLVLEVMGKLNDGYHQIKTIFQTVDLWDRVIIENNPNIEVKIINDAGIDPNNNLVLKAAQLLYSSIKRDCGAKITVFKEIPVGSGLGGGSSNAATTLYGLNLLWNLNLTKKQLTKIAARIGSDVPFFLEGGLALGTHKGDVIEGLSYRPDMWFVLVHIPHNIPEKTRFLYSKLAPSYYSRGSRVDSFLEYAKNGSFYCDAIHNVFSELAESAFPKLSYYKDALFESGAKHVSLSGTGPVLFSPTANEGTASSIYNKLAIKGIKAYYARSIFPGGISNV